MQNSRNNIAKPPSPLVSTTIGLDRQWMLQHREIKLESGRSNHIIRKQLNSGKTKITSLLRQPIIRVQTNCRQPKINRIYSRRIQQSLSKASVNRSRHHINPHMFYAAKCTPLFFQSKHGSVALFSRTITLTLDDVTLNINFNDLFKILGPWLKRNYIWDLEWVNEILTKKFLVQTKITDSSLHRLQLNTTNPNFWVTSGDTLGFRPLRFAPRLRTFEVSSYSHQVEPSNESSLV